MARVFVAMSGGVDSSVAAALLLEQGHDVTGVTMQLWPSSDEEGGCCSVSAVRDARRVCDLLGIAHYTLNYREVFEREVVEPFAREYEHGRTPNPCVVCNDRVKFADLLAKVSAQGAEFLATGHYARIVRDEQDVPWLARGVDPSKDQSYFLYRLTRAQMAHTLFPVGGLSKPEVRAIAERMGLPTASKAESQDICFATGGDHIPVVRKHAPAALLPGEIVDLEGAVVGTHEGIARYTVGQRKGIGIGGTGEPLYVIRVDAATNRVIVGPRSALETSAVIARDPIWRGGTPNDSVPGGEERVEAAVRYRMAPVAATARVEAGELTVTFDSPLLGVSPGQAVVCYREDIVIGGGTTWSAS